MTFENSDLKLVIPSDGAMYESTLEFMANVGLSVERESKRTVSYTHLTLPTNREV